MQGQAQDTRSTTTPQLTGPKLQAVQRCFGDIEQIIVEFKIQAGTVYRKVCVTYGLAVPKSWWEVVENNRVKVLGPNVPDKQAAACQPSRHSGGWESQWTETLGRQAPWAEEHLKGKAEWSKPENLLYSAHGFKLGQWPEAHSKDKTVLEWLTVLIWPSQTSLEGPESVFPQTVCMQPSWAWEDLQRRMSETPPVHGYKARCIIPKKTHGCCCCQRCFD